MVDPVAVLKLRVGDSLLLGQADAFAQPKRRRVAAHDASPQPGRAGLLEREIDHLGERGSPDSAALVAWLHEYSRSADEALPQSHSTAT